MTQCPCENVSLIFLLLTCYADMSQRPPEEKSDILRLGRSTPTSSARREKQALHPPMAGRGQGRGRLGGTRLARVDDAGASSS